MMCCYLNVQFQGQRVKLDYLPSGCIRERKFWPVDQLSTLPKKKSCAMQLGMRRFRPHERRLTKEVPVPSFRLIEVTCTWSIRPKVSHAPLMQTYAFGRVPSITSSLNTYCSPGGTWRVVPHHRTTALISCYEETWDPTKNRSHINRQKVLGMSVLKADGGKNQLNR